MTTAIEDRIATLQNQIDSTTASYDREKLQQRIAKLSGGIAVIKVDAATEVEMKEKKSGLMTRLTRLELRLKKARISMAIMPPRESMAI